MKIVKFIDPRDGSKHRYYTENVISWKKLVGWWRCMVRGWCPDCNCEPVMKCSTCGEDHSVPFKKPMRKYYFHRWLMLNKSLRIKTVKA